MGQLQTITIFFLIIVNYELWIVNNFVLLHLQTRDCKNYEH